MIELLARYGIEGQRDEENTGERSAVNWTSQHTDEFAKSKMWSVFILFASSTVSHNMDDFQVSGLTTKK